MRRREQKTDPVLKGLYGAALELPHTFLTRIATVNNILVAGDVLPTTMATIDCNKKGPGLRAGGLGRGQGRGSSRGSWRTKKSYISVLKAKLLVIVRSFGVWGGLFPGRTIHMANRAASVRRHAY
jgi:hypothetical protein